MKATRSDKGHARMTLPERSTQAELPSLLRIEELARLALHCNADRHSIQFQLSTLPVVYFCDPKREERDREAHRVRERARYRKRVGRLG